MKNRSQYLRVLFPINTLYETVLFSTSTNYILQFRQDKTKPNKLKLMDQICVLFTLYIRVNHLPASNAVCMIMYHLFGDIWTIQISMWNFWERYQNNAEIRCFNLCKMYSWIRKSTGHGNSAFCTLYYSNLRGIFIIHSFQKTFVSLQM